MRLCVFLFKPVKREPVEAELLAFPGGTINAK